MSKRHKQARQSNEPEPPTLTLWVRSDVMPDLSYAVTVSAGEDAVRVLNRDEAMAYAMTVLTACQRAAYDYAVYHLLTKLGVGEVDAVAIVAKDLRPDRPPLDDATTAPFAFLPGFTVKRPFVDIHVNGRGWGQNDVEPMREHALAVLMALPAADLDAQLKQVLLHTIGLPDGAAGAVVQDLAKYMR